MRVMKGDEKADSLLHPGLAVAVKQGDAAGARVAAVLEHLRDVRRRMRPLHRARRDRIVLVAQRRDVSSRYTVHIDATSETRLQYLHFQSYISRHCRGITRYRN